MKTYQPKEKEVRRSWNLVNADGEVLGRLASNVARLLIGKHKPGYSAHMDSGDYVVVINAKKIELTGKKAIQKTYFRHSGYPGGAKVIKFSKMFEASPAKVIQLAVAGMLPKNRLRSDRMARLKIFAGGEHPYNKQLGVK